MALQAATDEQIQEILASGEQIDLSRVYRNILSGKPRVTRFQIDWSPSGSQPQTQMAMDMMASQGGGMPSDPIDAHQNKPHMGMAMEGAQANAHMGGGMDMDAMDVA